MGKATDGKRGKSGKAKPTEVKARDRDITPPTPEQARRVRYDVQPVSTEMGQVVGRAYRRKPLYETLARTTKGIGRAQVEALAFYRTAHDRSERSATKSCLNVGLGGGRGEVDFARIDYTPALAEARRKVRLCEHALGALVTTMRAIVLDDRTFSEIAMERFGSRTRSWISVDEPVMRDGRPVRENGKVVKHAVIREDLVPRSGRHREIIAEEFRAGAALLTAQHRLLSETPGIEEIWIVPVDDGTATIRRGVCAPNGLYRLWGSSTVVGAVLIELHQAHGADLAFPSAEQARSVLDATARFRLIGLDENELAA